ncbi:hypothetical protein LEQ04_02040 [Riemerella anatipestifer]|nr:hypothetical protein LEQ04_02040 [Riemerella anatipestifer]
MKKGICKVVDYLPQISSSAFKINPISSMVESPHAAPGIPQDKVKRNSLIVVLLVAVFLFLLIFFIDFFINFTFFCGN